MSWFTGWFSNPYEGTNENLLKTIGTDSPTGMNTTPYYENSNGMHTAYGGLATDVSMGNDGQAQFSIPKQAQTPATYAPNPQVMSGMGGPTNNATLGDSGLPDWGAQLAMSALEHYKDMSNWANPGTTLGLLQNAGFQADTQRPYDEFYKSRNLLGW